MSVQAASAFDFETPKLSKQRKRQRKAAQQAEDEAQLDAQEIEKRSRNERLFKQLLIPEVGKYPIIYSLAIAKELRKNPEFKKKTDVHCAAAWKNLKRQYKHYNESRLKQAQTGRPGGRKSQKTRKDSFDDFYGLMAEFLTKNDEPRESSGNYDEEGGASEADKESGVIDDDDIVIHSSSSITETEAVDEGKSTKKRKPEEQSSQTSRSMVANAIAKISSNDDKMMAILKNEVSSDDFDKYVATIAPKLRRIFNRSPEEEAVTCRLIDDILFEAEFQHGRFQPLPPPQAEVVFDADFQSGQFQQSSGQQQYYTMKGL